VYRIPPNEVKTLQLFPRFRRMCTARRPLPAAGCSERFAAFVTETSPEHDRHAMTGPRQSRYSRRVDNDFQTETSMDGTILTYRGTVYPWHCDHMGHMNVMWYVGKFDEATWQLLGSVGLTAARCRRDRIGMAAVEQRIDYKRELFPGDAITIRSSVVEVRDKVIRLAHELIHDDTGEVAARTVIVGVHIDATTRRARSLPSDVRDLATLMVGQVDSAPRSEMAT
jgi:acyl-CoA thioester hydrolase